VTENAKNQTKREREKYTEGKPEKEEKRGKRFNGKGWTTSAGSKKVGGMETRDCVKRREFNKKKGLNY